MKNVRVSVVVWLAFAVLAIGPLGWVLGQDTGKTVNINQAGVAELQDLPGIGPAIAQRIVEYREKNGPFRKVEDLLNVRGIGEKKFERFKDRVTVGPVEEKPAAAPAAAKP
ncbi:MAG: hypothetical protein Kow00109_30310 [Acidobacteriota bacterium]